METVTVNKQVTRPPALATKNPKRVAAGRMKRMKRKGLTSEGWERLRQAALRNRPWRFSTGPRTSEGKAKSALNPKKQQKGLISVRQLRAQLADLRGLVQEMQGGRQLVGEVRAGRDVALP